MNSNNNKEDRRAWLYFAVFFAVAAFLFGYRLSSREQPTELIRTDTVTVIIRDTMVVEKPTEIYRYIIRYDTIRTNDIVIITDTVTGEQQAVVPIEQSVYSDSTENAQYTAYISGFRATLDSININCKNTETIITRTEIEKARRIGFGIQVGVGATRQGLSPYVGVGVQYRLW